MTSKNLRRITKAQLLQEAKELKKERAQAFEKKRISAQLLHRAEKKYYELEKRLKVQEESVRNYQARAKRDLKEWKQLVDKVKAKERDAKSKRKYRRKK